MSLDLTLHEPPCLHCKRYDEDDTKSFNYTYNVSGMWREAIGKDEPMVMIDGLTGEQSIPILEQAITVMEMSPEKYQAMNPINGWGSYDSFLHWLKEVLEAARSKPDWVWEAWR